MPSRRGPGQMSDLIIKQMAMFTHKYYEHSFALRAGNTKTYGVVKGEFEVLPDLADNLRQGVFRYPKTYPAWVRFAGPGRPFSTSRYEG